MIGKANLYYHDALLRILIIGVWGVFFGFIGLSFYFIITMSIGYFPMVGHDDFTLKFWQKNITDGQIINAGVRSFFTALIATILSLLISIVISAYLFYQQSQPLSSNRIMAMVSTIIAIPHQAFAIAMLFLLMPSGMIMRVIAQIIGADSPVGGFIIPDPYGLFYILLLTIKESCFLLLMIHAMVGRYQYQQFHISAISLGYHPMTAYINFIFPHIYKKLRLAIFIVLIYSIANIDIAYFTMVATKPTLAQIILELWHHPNFDKKLDASVCVLLLLILSLMAIFCWRIGEILWQYYFYHIIQNAQRAMALSAVRYIAYSILMILLSIIMALLTMVIWAFAGYWRFPDLYPTSFTIDHWQHYQDSLLSAAGNSIIIAVICSIVAIIIFFIHYQSFIQPKKQFVRMGEQMPYWILISLLIPQSCLLFGGTIILLILDIDQSYLAMIILQLLTVIPYVFLCLYLPFAQFSPMVIMQGLALGKSPIIIFWRIIVPILLPIILMAFAVGCAVSMADYLPVFFGGGGRYHSLSSLTIAMMNSGDYRALNMVAIWLSLMPMMIFLIVLIMPRLIFKNRRLIIAQL